MTKTATLHDGSHIEIEIHGNGPALLLPVNPIPIEGPQADEMRRWSADPALGRSLIDGLSDVGRIVAFDYEGQVMAIPKPETLTPANVVADFLAVADVAGADRFAYYGYSWLAMVGLQLALSTERLTGLAMGGYPQIDGPYEEMLKVTTIGHELATGARTSGGEDEWAAATIEPDQQRQFMTLYEGLQGFDERAALAKLNIDRVAFAGSKDEIQYGPSWGDVFVSIGGPLVSARGELEALGWEVHVLEGLDHIAAMQGVNVIPILRPWLSRIGTSAAS
jgi:pimeloyl-ACP methyl ester carboxylesterase